MNILPDIVKTNKRRMVLDKSTYHCTNCGSNFDIEIVRTDKCPICARKGIITTMRFRRNFEPICRNFWTNEEGTFNELISRNN